MLFRSLNLAKSSDSLEGSGLEGSAAEDLGFEGSGAEGSGLEGSGHDGLSDEGSGSGDAELVDHMDAGGAAGGLLVLSEEPELIPAAVAPSNPPDLVYVEPVSYDGASYPFLPPQEVVVPDITGEAAPHVVYPEPAFSSETLSSSDSLLSSEPAVAAADISSDFSAPVII